MINFVLPSRDGNASYLEMEVKSEETQDLALFEIRVGQEGGDFSAADIQRDNSLLDHIVLRKGESLQFHDVMRTKTHRIVIAAHSNPLLVK